MPQFGTSSAQSLISCAWLSCLPNNRWLGARLRAGGSQPLLLLSPAGKQRGRSRPRQGLVTRPLPPPGARGTWRGEGRRLSLRSQHSILHRPPSLELHIVQLAEPTAQLEGTESPKPQRQRLGGIAFLSPRETEKGWGIG